MDTSDILIGLAAAAGAVYFIKRSDRKEDEPRASGDDDARAAITVASPMPVSSPSQVDATTPKRDRFDPIFETYRGGIPLEYLRALAIRESDLDPDLASGPAWGLLQVVEVVRRDYNQRRGTRYTRGDLLNPRINVAIVADTLRVIAASYARNHPTVPNLRTAWSNPRFAELLTYGWVAGFSESGGVGRVARHLVRRGVTDITIDLIRDHAIAAGASHVLARADKVRWAKSVVALYLAERARARAANPAAAAA